MFSDNAGRSSDGAGIAGKSYVNYGNIDDMYPELKQFGNEFAPAPGAASDSISKTPPASGGTLRNAASALHDQQNSGSWQPMNYDDMLYSDISQSFGGSSSGLY